MRYINSTVIKGEKIILTPNIHKIVYIMPFIFLGILSIILLFAGCIDMTLSTWIALAVCELGGVLITSVWYLYDKLYYTRVEMATTLLFVTAISTRV